VCLSGLACTKTISPPELGQLYSRAAQYHGIEKNPVIVIPGILGSKLKDSTDGTSVWGAYTGEYANPKTVEGLRLLALPMEIGTDIKNLRDEVVSTEVLDTVKVSVFGLPIEVAAYTDILGTLGAGGYRDQTLGMVGAIDYGSDHFSCFQFAYDWRRDIVEGAKKLDEFINEKREFVELKQREFFGENKPEIKFDVVAHSMGGLVLRYYLRYGTQDLPEDGSLPELTWEGAKNISKVVLIATPNAGALEGLEKLIGGTDYGYPVPTYPSSILGTYATLYQLLPRQRHGRVVDSQTKEKLNLYDPKLWQEMGWGLADEDQLDLIRKMLPETRTDEEARLIALDHQAKMLKRSAHLHRALDHSP